MPASDCHLIVQISDTHILPPGQWLDQRVDTATGLRAAVRRIRALQPAPLGVLVTGDLVDAGTPQHYAHLRELLSSLEVPVWLMPGNHDDREALRAAFPEHSWLCNDNGAGFIQYTVDLPGLRLVTLDTVVPGAGHGALCRHRLDWLDRTLAQAPLTPTLVAMHHPPFDTHIGHMDAMGLLEGCAAFTDLVGRHRQVERIVCGHIHRSVQRRLAHTVALTIPSTAHQITLEIGDGPGSYLLEPPGLALHVWRHGQDLTSHLLPTGDFPGPFAFD
ncbi:MAG TPA: phosphodiesterase [Hydrogenophaga sp.]|uniref:phosphodiesterase n=1 Tax=Hydrogenophaga sp. TaxID=1904254 RepID=UPI002B9652B0|nr:phosphodiesterase [Hydrogenophaga sp.]HMN93816.1 phosphodiesterase [Hydrogenophaga sp.]HMP09661.1 phosphodiesterase [Hydrogenophaga sp.]